MSNLILNCEDKIPFTTKEEAIGAKTLARHRYGTNDLIVYSCKECKMWHLARSDKEE